jgi:CHAT domain-containing protein
VRSGVRSTIATLWRVNDQASAVLMGRFYQELAKIEQTKISKAEALRRAQLSLLKDPVYKGQPYYWAPYLLIGNWT